MFHRVYRCCSSVTRAVGVIGPQTPAVGVLGPQMRAAGVPVPKPQAVGVPVLQISVVVVPVSQTHEVLVFLFRNHKLLVFLFRKHTCCWCSCSANRCTVSVPVPQTGDVGVLVPLALQYVTHGDVCVVSTFVTFRGEANV